MHHNKKGMRVAEIKIKEEKVEEDGAKNYPKALLHLTLSSMVEPDQLAYEH